MSALPTLNGGSERIQKALLFFQRKNTLVKTFAKLTPTLFLSNNGRHKH